MPFSFVQALNVLLRKEGSENVRTICLLKIKPEGNIHLQKYKSNIIYSLLCNSKHLTFIAPWNTKEVILQNVQTALIHAIKLNSDHV